MSDVLIYKNKKHAEFYLSASESEVLEGALGKKITPVFVKMTLPKFLKRVQGIEKILAKKNPSAMDTKKMFILNSELFPLERIIFLVPHLVLEHGIPFRNKKLVEQCAKVRKETEELFYTIDKFFSCQETYAPAYIKRYKNNLREFVIFNNTIETRVAEIKNLKKVLQENSGDRAKELKGFSACKGKVAGTVKIILSRKDYGKMRKGDILVAANTRPDYITVIKKASAIITDEGGITSHAAIISRELNIPCIVGTKNATRLLKDGDRIVVDANRGIVFIKKKTRR